jgi:putative RNA 2'-phosphotransferase
MAGKRKHISKFMAYILRHNPEKFGLQPDQYGYVNIDELISIINKKHKNFDRKALLNLVEKDKKNRYKIKDNKIRARYGHSINVMPEQQPVQPPEILYHGTSPQSAQKILKSGLRPMNRQFVHLSLNKKDARQVGLRHSSQPVILKILALAAHQDGINFIREKGTYLTRKIPPKYIIKLSDS